MRVTHRHHKMHHITRTKRRRRATVSKNRAHKKTRKTRNIKKARRTRKGKRTNKTRHSRHVKRGGGPDDIFTTDQLDAMSLREMVGHLSTDNLSKYRREISNLPNADQKRRLYAMLWSQSISNEALKKYRDDTPKYMVTEPGMMPYDSRLINDHTQHHEDRPNIWQAPKFIVLIQGGPDSPKTVRMKIKFQNSWRVKDNHGDDIPDMTVNDVNTMIRQADRDSRNRNHAHPVSMPYAQRLRTQFYDAFHAYMNEDPDFLAAQQEERVGFHEGMGMGVADRESTEIEAPARAVTARAAKAKSDSDEKALSESEELRGKLSWSGVKRRRLDWDMSNTRPWEFAAHTMLRDRNRTNQPTIRFASGAEMAEAVTPLRFGVPPEVRDRMTQASSVNDAIDVLHAHMRNTGGYDSYDNMHGVMTEYDDDYEIVSRTMYESEAEEYKNIDPRCRYTKDGKNMIKLLSGTRVEVVDDLPKPPAKVAAAGGDPQPVRGSKRKIDLMRERQRKKMREAAEAKEAKDKEAKDKEK